MGQTVKPIEDFFRELKYQDAYTYEEKVDLFNAFQIPVSQEFFFPFFTFMSLHISSFRNVKFRAGYSHSGAISSMPYAKVITEELDKIVKEKFRLYGNELTIHRNKETQQLVVALAEVGGWKIRLDPKRFTFTAEFDWKKYKETEGMSSKSLLEEFSVVKYNPEESELFLKLTKFKL